MEAIKRVIVSHPVFGEGEVISSRLNGHELLVHFNSGLKLWVLKKRLLFISETDALEKKFDRIKAKRICEALRMGIVPRQDCEDFTFGREEEVNTLKKIIEKLKEGKGDTCLIEGEYGSGKTHLLEYLYHYALKEGVCVSKITLTPDEVSPHRPKRFWKEFVFNLKFLKDDREYGFRDLLRQATNLNLYDNIFFSKLLPKLKNIDEGSIKSEVLWQWLEGESTKEYAVYLTNKFRIKGGIRIPALYDFSTASDFYCYLISSLSYIAHQLNLYGILLLIDEAETVAHLWRFQDFLKGLNFLYGLIRVCYNDQELKKIDNQMIHNKMRPTPYIYRDAYLSMVMATTPLSYNYEYLRLTTLFKNKITLKNLKIKDLYECFYTLYNIYKTCYPNFQLLEREQRKILEEGIERSLGIRDFLKFVIEVFDIYRHTSSLVFINK
ncbi:MAG: DUF2791 family P-loop domain-containing protein [candidate division WOR-3 bacterium]|nr:DUF2791 family P-loop domain-containing protein [candidate division WOR-3 bacterium]MCX7837450.1 DUF2791 family P-loop domain-containing protein [candidate division WOR-3 bacterium]MDW8113618.1 DUF2791 family P-loop domain-containing protein [candidate division WOR-3 bacterium]